MSHEIHAAIIDRIKELSQLAESYSEAAKTITRIKNLEVELKMPGSVVINRAEKENQLRKLKEQFNDIQLIHLFSNDI